MLPEESCDEGQIERLDEEAERYEKRKRQEGRQSVRDEKGVRDSSKRGDAACERERDEGRQEIEREWRM